MFIAAAADLRGGTVVLTGPEGRHAATVRRLAPGERAMLTDAAGTVAECMVSSASGGTVEFTVLERRTEPAPQPAIAVAQALPKGDRAELAAELMTEVGVDLIVPWQARRCVVQWHGERAGRALERWRKTAREAAKQSRRAWFPEVAEPVSLPGLAGLVTAASLAVILDPDAPGPLSDLSLPAAGQILLIVGPEGGISPEESARLTQAGAVGARLGPGILRTSTAGAVAAAFLLSASGRWGQANQTNLR
ncbi:MAG TPA: 16S rRNA (uracil(1498)-N(3))-methyltransferase [Streptosporangiaceae bacterium]